MNTPVFQVGAGDLNSGPLAFTASAFIHQAISLLLLFS